MNYKIEFQVLKYNNRYHWVNRSRKIEAASPDAAWEKVEAEFKGSSLVMIRISQFANAVPKQKLSDILDSIPNDVADCVRLLMAEHHTHKVRFVLEPANQTLYLAEDYEYHFFRNGDKKTVEMDGEWNGYTKTAGKHVNEYLPVPQGTYCVSWFWYGNVITIKHWGLEAIEA